MKKIFSLSITTQITTILTGAVVLSLILVGGILTYISVQAQFYQLNQIDQAQAQVVSEQVNSYFDDLQRKLTFLARVRGLMTLDVVAQHNLLEGLVNHNSAYKVVGITDNQGHLLQSFSKTDEAVAQDWRGTVAFRRAFQEQEDYFGTVEMTPGQAYPTLILAVPARDEQNNVSGMLFARVDLKFIWAILDETQVGKTGYVYIVNRRQIVIAQSRDVRGQFAFDDLSQKPLGKLLSDPAHVPQTYRGLRDEMVLGNIVDITSANWYVVIELPVSEAYAPLYNLLGVMSIGLILGILVFGALGVLLARQITQPLGQLTGAAAQFSRGALETRVVIHQQNELKVLADAFNQMAAQLSDTINQLQQDIIERKQAEDALRRSEEEFHSLAESMPQIVWVTRSDGWNIYFNQRWVDYTGLALEKSYGHGWNKPFHPDDQQRAWDAWQNATQNNGTYSLECRLRRADGVYRWWLIRAEPLLGTQGEILKWFGTSTDIDDMKQAQEALYASLTEKETLLKEVHHRVKNNLASITSLISLQQDGLSDPAIIAEFQELSGRIKSMALVHELLYQNKTLSHIELQKYLEKLAYHLRASFSSRVKVELEIAAYDVGMNLDYAIPCGLIVNELITNSFKYAFPNGKPRAGETGCKIAVIVQQDANVYTLTVRDNGVGLPEGFDWTTTKSLGLQLVSMLGRGQLHGTVELDRTNGTTFRLRFAVKDKEKR